MRVAGRTISIHYYSPVGSKVKERTELSDDNLRRVAPSIFAEGMHESRSDKYAMIPTTELLAGLRDSGWKPVSAREQGVRNQSRSGFQKHEIRFTRTEGILRVGDSVVDVVLTNSHDGSSSYTLEAGIFRPVCTNGMIVSENLFEKVRVRHIGADVQDVIDITAEVVEAAPAIADRVETFQSIELPEPVQEAFAREALVLRYGLEDPEEIATKAPVDARHLLIPRRREDEPTSGRPSTASRKTSSAVARKPGSASPTASASPSPGRSKASTRTTSSTPPCSASPTPSPRAWASRLTARWQRTSLALLKINGVSPHTPEIPPWRDPGRFTFRGSRSPSRQKFRHFPSQLAPIVPNWHFPIIKKAGKLAGL